MLKWGWKNKMAKVPENIGRPTRDNVEKGDFLVVDLPCHFGCGVLQIKRVKENQIGAREESSSAHRTYNKAIVLKKDGTYLVGDTYRE